MAFLLPCVHRIYDNITQNLFISLRHHFCCRADFEWLLQKSFSSSCHVQSAHATAVLAERDIQYPSFMSSIV